MVIVVINATQISNKPEELSSVHMIPSVRCGGCAFPSDVAGYYLPDSQNLVHVDVVCVSLVLS